MLIIAEKSMNLQDTLFIEKNPKIFIFGRTPCATVSHLEDLMQVLLGKCVTKVDSPPTPLKE